MDSLALNVFYRPVTAEEIFSKLTLKTFKTGAARMTQKIDFNSAINLFEEEFKEIKKGIESRGYRSAWVSKVPETNEHSSFLPKGKTKHGIKCYLSDCPHYNGIYLCGGAGALDCNLVSEHLPGIVQDLHCSKKHNKCPIKTYKGEN